MSRPGDFNRLDNAGGTDRLKRFKANVNEQLEYREAYAKLSARDPQAALGLPHPDGPAFDQAAALEAIRKLNAKFQADPRLDIKA